VSACWGKAGPVTDRSRDEAIGLGRSPLPHGRIGVLEHGSSGHRLQYVRHLVAAAGVDRCSVLTTRRVTGSGEYATHLAPIAPTAVVLDGPETRLELLRAAISWAEAIGATQLIIPDGDKYLVPLLMVTGSRLRLPCEVRLLLLRTTSFVGPERPGPTAVVKPVLVQLLGLVPRVRLFFLTDAFGVVTRRPGYRGVRPVKDPVLRKEAVGGGRPSWLPPSDPAVTIVGVFGAISTRKNVPLLVAAIAEVREAVLVLAGHLEAEVRTFIDTDATALALRNDGRMVMVDRFLAPDELSAALAAVDLVAVLHDNNSPSGILAEACVRHTPVLVPRGGWLGRVVESTHVGAATPLDVLGVAEGVRRVQRNRQAFVAATRREERSIGTTDFTDRLLGDGV
jgi:hypothetical protein